MIRKIWFLGTLSTCLAPLKPFPIPPTAEPTIEIAEFESTSEKDVHPYTSYINHLYVYPQTLCFDSQKMFTRARNIACIVELRDDDGENVKPLRVWVIEAFSCTSLYENWIYKSLFFSFCYYRRFTGNLVHHCYACEHRAQFCITTRYPLGVKRSSWSCLQNCTRNIIYSFPFTT